MTLITPIQVTVYRVKYQGKYGKRPSQRFKTEASAISKMAWWMIFDKYENGTGWRDGEHTSTLFPPPAECKCNEYDPHHLPDYGPNGPDCCPLHNKATGYYARVHTRLVSYIKARCAAIEAEDDADYLDIGEPQYAPGCYAW